MNLNELETIRRARIDMTLALLNDGAELDAELKDSMKSSANPVEASRKRKRLRRLLDGLVRSL